MIKTNEYKYVMVSWIIIYILFAENLKKE